MREKDCFVLVSFPKGEEKIGQVSRKGGCQLELCERKSHCVLEISLKVSAGNEWVSRNIGDRRGFSDIARRFVLADFVKVRPCKGWVSGEVGFIEARREERAALFW